MTTRRTGSVICVALLGLATTVACSSAHVAAPRCQSDDQCGGGLACVAGTCLPRAAPPAQWDVEVVPRAESASAFTELHGISGSADAFDLTASAKVTLTGTLTFEATGAPLATAHVTLSVPATIAGRPDLQFETDLLKGADAKTPTFTLSIPLDLMGRAGTLRVTPTAPDDLTHPAATFAVTVGATLSLPISSSSLTVRGRLLSAFGDPVVGLLARGFENGALVTNLANTLGDGSFSLFVPGDQLDATKGTRLSVELEPATADAAQPHFWAKPFTFAGSIDLGDIHLPAYSQPNAFSFGFQGDAANHPSVPSAIVRARTLLADDLIGTTDFERDGLTDATGLVSLDLFPGSTTAARLYDIAVIPPPASPFAALCLEKFPLVTGGLPPPVTLARRPTVSNTLVGDDLTPVAGAVVLATRTAPERATACDTFASTPQLTATTDASGTFTMALDAGTYTFDYDPPAGAPYPRLTETGLVVSSVSASGGAAARVVKLPPGALVEGTVGDGAGRPLNLAGVRFYGPACGAPLSCAGAPPPLEAQAHSDASGHFRAVIPLASPATSPDAGTTSLDATASPDALPGPS